MDSRQYPRHERTGVPPNSEERLEDAFRIRGTRFESWIQTRTHSFPLKEFTTSLSFGGHLHRSRKLKLIPSVDANREIVFAQPFRVADRFSQRPQFGF